MIEKRKKLKSTFLNKFRSKHHSNDKNQHKCDDKNINISIESKASKGGNDFFAILFKGLITLTILMIVIPNLSNKKGEETIKIKAYNYAKEIERDIINYAKEIERNIIPEKEVEENSRVSIFKKNNAVNSISNGLKDRNVAIIDFNSRNGYSEFDRFQRKVDYIIANKSKFDEVVIRIYSLGGSVIDYGSAMSEIKRLKNQNLKTTAMVDEVAASGGYLMATVADKVYANDFAFVGSIGVVASIPNFKKMLDGFGVSVNEYTAGESKRNVTPYKEITEEDVNNLNSSLVKIHNKFKDIVKENRVVNEDVAFTGEIFFGENAIENGLIDGIINSSDYIYDLYEKNNGLILITAIGDTKLENVTGKNKIMSDFIDLVFNKFEIKLNENNMFH